MGTVRQQECGRTEKRKYKVNNKIPEFFGGGGWNRLRKKMLHLPPFYNKREDYRTGNTETDFTESKMKSHEMYATEIENEEIDELEREVWRIFHQESDEKEKDGDDERLIWQGKMRYMADIVLNMLIMLLPVLLSIMVTGFLIQGGKVFWCRLADLWRGKENKRNF